jgi:ABC-2 type transport system permease protein
MNSAIKSEYLKLATLRSTRYTFGLAPLVAAAVAAVGVHLLPAADGLVLTDGPRGVAEAMWFIVSVVAILAGAGEFQHRTVLTTLLATPRRLTVLAAKAAVIAAYGAILTAVGMGACLTATLITASSEGVQIQVGDNASWAGLAGAALVGALFGMLSSALA